MTIEQADKIADIILSAPKVYDPAPNWYRGPQYPPTEFQIGDKWVTRENIENSPWCIGHSKDQVGLPSKQIYWCGNGFGPGYDKEVVDWDKTPVPDTGRYVTLDDINMIYHVGMENYRAKILGHRWKYYERQFNQSEFGYPRGYIVRQEDGKRWICGKPSVFPIPGIRLGIWGGARAPYWYPFTRRQSFGKPTSEHIPLESGINFPFEKVTRFIKVASITGHNDLVQLRNIWDFPDEYNRSSDAYYINPSRFLNSVGRMEVRISEYDNLEKEENQEVIESQSIVWAISNCVPIYMNVISTGRYAKDLENLQDSDVMYSLTPENNINYVNQPYYAKYTVYNKSAYMSSFIPLKKGKTYHIYIGRKESHAALGSGQEPEKVKGGNLVVVRIPTKGIAPNF